MAVVVVPVDPPREGLVLQRLAETSPLSEAEAAELYAALVRDVAVAAELSGGDLLVNYRPDESLPEDHRTDEPAEAAVRATVAPALEWLDEARFERQVGSTRSARVGNTVAHLLDEEGASGVLVVEPTAALVGRTGIDGATMKLRTDEVVLGPAPGGRVHLAGFSEPIDFTDAFEAHPLETLTARAGDAGLGVAFGEPSPVVETEADLVTLTSLVRARADAGRVVPEYALAAIRDLGVTPVDEDGEIRVARGTDRS